MKGRVVINGEAVNVIKGLINKGLGAIGIRVVMVTSLNPS